MKKKIAIIALVLLAVGLSSVYAGNIQRTGTAGALELVIPVGSRGTSMGGALVANTAGVESIVWNPAGLAFTEGTEAAFSHLSYIADINVNFAGVATVIEDIGTLGVSAKVVSIGDMEETTREYPEGTGRIFSPTMAVIGISYATSLTHRVSFGTTMMFIREEIFEVAASGMAFDVGFIYDPGWRGVTLGFAIKNYGPEMQFTGRGFASDLEGRPAYGESRKFDLPSSINMGAAVEFLNDGPNLATFSTNYRSNNYYNDYYQGGVEYVYDDMFSLRGGYSYSESDYWLYGMCFGGGVKLDVAGTKVTFEYSWTETEVFDNNQYFTVKAGF